MSGQLGGWFTDQDGKPKAASIDASSNQAAKPKRQIEGNFPYAPTVAPLKRALERLIVSEKPAVFHRDFLNTVLEVKGGSASSVVPILKKVGFLSTSSVPTELYSEFQSENGRAAASLAALKNGFSEIFKRNKVAHQCKKDDLIDIIRTTTGLPKGDPIITYVYNTFAAFQEYAKGATENSNPTTDVDRRHDNTTYETPPLTKTLSPAGSIGLSYQINIVLPESSNVDVFNAIFKSLRENLLK